MTSLEDIKEYLTAYDMFVEAAREKELKRIAERLDEYGNKRPILPWKVYSLEDLIDWMLQEVNELLEAIESKGMTDIEDELLDVSNFCRFTWCAIHLEDKKFAGEIISERHDDHLDDYPIEFGEAVEVTPMKIGAIKCSKCGRGEWIALWFGVKEKLQLRCRLCSHDYPSVEVDIKSMKATHVHFEEMTKGEKDEQDNPDTED